MIHVARNLFKNYRKFFFRVVADFNPEKAIFFRTFEFVPTRCSVNHSFVPAETYDSIDLTIESFVFSNYYNIDVPR